MIPTFATAGVLIAPSAPLLSSGYVPGNTLGAQHFNWYLNHLTAELNNLLLAAGISQSAANDSQVLGAVNVLAAAARDSAVLVPATTSYNMPANGSSRFLMAVPAGSGSAVFNVPAAASIVGSAITVVKTDAGSGLIRVLANGSDTWEATGSPTMWLGSPYQSIVFVAFAAGKLRVIGGSPVPDQGVDTGGAQANYSLGKLVHLPLGNATDFSVVNGTPPAAGNWSSAIQVAGLKGVPLGAKAILAKVTVATGNVTNAASIQVGFSDNNANVPGYTTRHPIAEMVLGTGGSLTDSAETACELVIPLNQAGQFYYYVMQRAGVGTSLVVVPTGYYMGD